MKNFIILILFVSFSFCTTVSVAKESKLLSIDSQIQKLFQSHSKFISNTEFGNSDLSDLERVFFSDFSFLNSGNTRNFFQNIQHDIESGKVYPGLMQVSYTSYSSINGKVTGVTYNYKSDGKNIYLSKGTFLNGEMLKAVYNYDMQGKLLHTTEIKGSKLINKNTYRLEI